jgi:hypothetical protein
MKMILASVLIVWTWTATAQTEIPPWQELQGLLGKPVASGAVQRLVKANHLIQSQTLTNGTGICQNLTNVPFVLVYSNNTICEVSIAVGYTTLPKYTGKLPHDLKPTDTAESVVHRLGEPSRRIDRPSFIWMRYERLGLNLDFDRNSGCLAGVTLLCK